MNRPNKTESAIINIGYVYAFNDPWFLNEIERQYTTSSKSERTKDELLQK